MLPRFRLAEWRVDASLHTVAGESGPVRLEPKVLQVLICLAEHAGEVVPKAQLIETVWRGTFVTDDVLARAISELRRVFHDDARHPRMIETVPKAGYRLIAPVVVENPGSSLPRVAHDSLPRPVMRREAAAAVARVRAEPMPSAGQGEAAPLPDGAAHQPTGRILRPEFASTEPQPESRVTGFRHTASRNVTLAGALLAAVVLAAVAHLLMPWSEVAPPQPRVTGYRALTRHEVLFPPFPSEMSVLTDGPRIYFNQFINGVLRGAQVSAAGGAPEALDFGLGQHEIIDAISPDGSELLVGAFTVDGTALSDVPYWIVPLVGGTARRLGTVTGHGSTWLPDGRILYAHGNDLFVVGSDGTDNTKIASVGGRPYWPRLSPDGRRIRFARFSSPSTFRIEALWEVGIDGSGLRPLLPGWNVPPAECCGEWTPDGAYYVFQATRDGATHLWALRERGPNGETSAPVQLTHGPVQFRRPVFSRDGRRIFVHGWQQRGELTRLDPRSGALSPYSKGLSAEWATHSADQRWLAYVTYPEGELWRARADGSNQLRLTAARVRACCPRISPDARHVAFVAEGTDMIARTYIAGMEGTALRAVGDGGEATWSADADRLVIVTGDGLTAISLASGMRSNIPGSGSLVSPVWSRDGRRLAAVSSINGELRVYDRDTGRWRGLTGQSVAYPSWSRNGDTLYFFTGRPAPGVIETISRWNLKTGHLERLLDVRDVRLAWGIRAHWLGLAPDDSPLFLRELSTHDMYALDWHVAR